MEKVITCPHCLDTNNCFEEVQETFSSYLCFSCGFMSDSRYEVGNLQLIENMKSSPQLVRESQFVEQRITTNGSMLRWLIYQSLKDICMKITLKDLT